MNKIYEDYIREKVHEQLIGMAKRMLEDDILSLEKDCGVFRFGAGRSREFVKYEKT